MSITGNLRTLDLTELLQWLAQGQKTGALVVQNGELRKRIFFRCGKIISSESNNPDEHLGCFLIREGLIDEPTLARAVKLQESTQILLGKVLVTLGSISEEELHRILLRKTQESIFDLFTWREGEFRFVPQDLPELPMVPIELDVTNVVLEGMRRLDEARHDLEEASRETVPQAGDEIEQMLDSDIFRGPPLESVDDGAFDSTMELSAPLVDEIPVEDTIQTSPVHGADEGGRVEGDVITFPAGSYYLAVPTRKTIKAPLIAAAAGVAVILIGSSAYFLLPPGPAEGTAEPNRLGRVASAVGPPSDPQLGVFPPSDSERGAEPSTTAVSDPFQEVEVPRPPTARTDPPPQPQAREVRDEPRSRDAEPPPQPAQRAARSEPPDKSAREPQQRTPARESPTRLAANPARTQVPVTPEVRPEPEVLAGGDEPPQLAGTLPVRELPSDDSADLAAALLDRLGPVDSVSPGDLVEPGPGVEAPVLLSQPRPRYPPAALRLGQEATVVVRVLVNEAGRVIETTTAGAPAGMGFDRAALAVAENTSWRPAIKDGIPVKMWSELRVAFRR